MADQTPLYNLKAVTNMVGLSPATLRAWERRYGLLKPVRTPGGHRLYSRQDIEMLKWLVERQNEGLSISRAVEMWNRLKESGAALPSQIVAPRPGEVILDELRQQWLNACLAFDEQSSNHILDQAFSIAAPETICSEVLLKGLAQVGELWYGNSVTVQQEHFITAIAARKVNALIVANMVPTREGRILAACPPGEEHDFVILTISYLLRRQGWDVVYLGANVPIHDLDTTIESTSPVLILSAAQTLESAASLRRVSEYLVSKNVPLAYGGGIFSQLPMLGQSISGHFLGKQIAGVVPVVERLIESVSPAPLAMSLSREYSQTLVMFQQKKASIIEFVTATTQAQTPNPAYLPVAIERFAGLIISALELGDIKYLDQTVAWLSGLLVNYKIPEENVKEILGTFLLAVDGYLGEDSAIINTWLKQQLVYPPDSKL